MIFYSSSSKKKKKCIKRYGFSSFARNLSNKYGNPLLDTATKTALGVLKTTSKKDSIRQLK